MFANSTPSYFFLSDLYYESHFFTTFCNQMKMKTEKQSKINKNKQK